MLLSVASPIFRALCNGKLDAKIPIKIVDIRPEIFQFLLDFIYTDQAFLETFEQARDVWHAAHKYMITKLTEICATHILQILSPNNAFEAYEVAKGFDRLDLMQQSLQVLAVW